MQRSNPDVFRFYHSKQWNDVRKAYKLYRHNLCERCGGVGYIVHHKKYINSSNIFNPEVTLNFENLELLCLDCHNKEHLAEFELTPLGEVKEQNKSAFELLEVYKK